MAEPGGAARRTEAGGQRGRGGGAFGWLFAGVVIGALGAVFLPGLAAPYLPGAFRGERVEVAGVVESKSTEAERLLLTVGSEAGAMLATFRDGIAEIDLLVSVGDSVLLTVDEYAPFVDNARISRVMKQGDWRAGPARTSDGPGGMETSDETGEDAGAAAPAPDTMGTPEGAADTNDMMDTSDTLNGDGSGMDTTNAEAADESPPAPVP